MVKGNWGIWEAKKGGKGREEGREGKGKEEGKGGEVDFESLALGDRRPWTCALLIITSAVCSTAKHQVRKKRRVLSTRNVNSLI